MACYKFNYFLIILSITECRLILKYMYTCNQEFPGRMIDTLQHLEQKTSHQENYSFRGYTEYYQLPFLNMSSRGNKIQRNQFVLISRLRCFHHFHLHHSYQHFRSQLTLFQSTCNNRIFDSIVK